MDNAKNIKAILFDLDGVLVDSFDAWLCAYNDTLQKFGKDGLEREKFRKEYWGLGLSENIEKLGLGKKAAEYCLSRYNVQTDKVKILPKAKETLEILDKRKGLVTNTPKVPTEKILGNHDLDRYFEAVVSADEVGKGKPAPDMIIEACKILEVDPTEILLIGDSESDIKACKKVGCNPIRIGSADDANFESIEELYKGLSENNNLLTRK